MSRFQKYLNGYFGFSQTENKGFWILALLLVLALIMPLVMNFLPQKQEGFITDKAKLDSLQTAIVIKQNEAKNSNFEDKEYAKNDNFSHFSENKNLKLFAFNPNEIGVEQWQRLGLPKFLAERIIKYRNAGGKFKKKEDLAKIYGLRPETYQQLLPYIQLDTPKNAEYSTKNEEGKPAYSTTEKRNFPPPISPFDLNEVDTTQLIKLKGIGSKIATRIIKFRESLGGFYAENQLQEVFGIDSLAKAELQKYGSIKSPKTKKINLNKATAEDLKHPYLRPYIAKIILAYRNQHGSFASVKDLEKIKVLDPKTIEKLSPYLEF